MRFFLLDAYIRAYQRGDPQVRLRARLGRGWVPSARATTCPRRVANDAALLFRGALGPSLNPFHFLYAHPLGGYICSPETL